MANFIELDNNKYKLDGVLTSEDVVWINSLSNKTLIIADNTLGMRSEILKGITSECVLLSVKGGLDYDEKSKYNSNSYISRTMYSPKGLVKILSYFEYNEKFIDTNWSERQTAMFLYNALAVDINYFEKYDKVLESGIAERSMNGILYGKLVCAGYALTFHEMLTRVSIKSHYQNQKQVHAFNIIEVDGETLGVDVTWDSFNKIENELVCPFMHFGVDENFYNKHGHQLYKEEYDFEKNKEVKNFDEDEEYFELTTITPNNVVEDLKVIKEAIMKRKKVKYDLSNQEEQIKWEYLPVDLVRKKMQKDALENLVYLEALLFLKRYDMLTLTEEQIEAAYKLYSVYADIREKSGKLNISIIDKLNHMLTINRINSHTIYKKGEIDKEKNRVNSEVSEYLDNYLRQCVNEVSLLISAYANDDALDENRKIKNAITYSKIMFVYLSKNHLLKLGYNDNYVSQLLSEISIFLKNKIKDENDTEIEYLEAIFSDIQAVKKHIEKKLGKSISDNELFDLYNFEYLTSIFELALEEYNITKEQFDNLLKKILVNSMNEIENKSEKFH